MTGEFLGNLKGKPHRCELPGTSSLTEGDGWRCACGKGYILELVDYGHDVQQGEPSSELKWRRYPAADGPLR